MSVSVSQNVTGMLYVSYLFVVSICCCRLWFAAYASEFNKWLQSLQIIL